MCTSVLVHALTVPLPLAACNSPIAQKPRNGPPVRLTGLNVPAIGLTRSL